MLRRKSQEWLILSAWSPSLLQIQHLPVPVSSAPLQAGKSPNWFEVSNRKITYNLTVHGFQQAMELMTLEGTHWSTHVAQWFSWGIRQPVASRPLCSPAWSCCWRPLAISRATWSENCWKWWELFGTCGDVGKMGLMQDMLQGIRIKINVGFHK